jgi:hypothetical protein
VTRHIFLAVGHGRRPNGTIDPGAMTADGRRSEQSEGDLIVQHCARILRDAGFRVTSQRAGDPNFAGTNGYTATASRLGVDLAVSVHHDWNRAPRGFFCHWASGAGTAAQKTARLKVNRAAADAMFAAVAEAGLPTRPSWHKERTDLTFTTATTVPAVLVEADRVGEVADHEAMGRAIAFGICDFFGTPRPGRIISFGDHGHDVERWNLTLDRLFPHHRGAGLSANRFDAFTVERTLLVLRYGDMTASDPARPRVGLVTRGVAERMLKEPWVGKRVKIKTNGLRWYPTPGWHPQTPAGGQSPKGAVWHGGIVRLLEVGAGRQYEVLTRGAALSRYVTASPAHVELI